MKINTKEIDDLLNSGEIDIESSNKNYVNDELSSQLYEDKKRLLDLEKLRHENKQRKLDNQMRKSFADKVYSIVIFWLIAIFILILLHGQKIWLFEISDTVMITILTSTTVTILGLFVLVLNYLFPTKNNNTKIENF